MSDTEYVKTIKRVERTGGTFRILFTDGTTAKTKAKSQVNFTIENSENIGVPLNVKTMRNGDVYSVTPLP